MLDKIKAYIKEHKNISIGIGSAIILLILIILLIVLMPSNNIIKNPLDNTNTTVETPSDNEKLDEILKNINNSDIEIISNIDNDQADVILKTIGVEITDLYSYAAVVDSRNEAVNTIAILRPKEDKKQAIREALLLYINDKQIYYIDNNLTELEQYKDVLNGIVSTIGDYVILVLHSDQSEILNNIESALANSGLLGTVTIAGTPDMYE